MTKCFLSVMNLQHSPRQLSGDLGSRRLTREEARLARVEAEEKVFTMSMMYLQGVPKKLLTIKELCWEAGLFGKIGPKWSTLAQNGSNWPKQPRYSGWTKVVQKFDLPIFPQKSVSNFLWVTQYVSRYSVQPTPCYFVIFQ